MPGAVCSLSSSSCSLNAEAVVLALKLWTVGSCVLGHRMWLVEEDHSGKGDEVVRGVWQCSVGVFIL